MTTPIISPDPLPETKPTRPVSAPTTVTVSGGGGSSCIFVMGGCMAMLVLIVVLLGAALAATGTQIGNFFSGFGNLFNGSGGSFSSRVFVVPEVDPFTQLSSLTTLAYNYSNVVQMSTDMPPVMQSLYGTSQVLIAVGSVEAGVDLSQMTQNSLTFDPERRTLTITLPAAHITNCFLNDQKTYVAERTSGVFAPDNVSLDTASRRYAIQQFLALAQEDKLLVEAKGRAEDIVRNFTKATLSETDQDIIIEVTSIPPDTDALPETCQ